jgi:hypothetical protein
MPTLLALGTLADILLIVGLIAIIAIAFSYRQIRKEMLAYESFLTDPCTGERRLGYGERTSSLQFTDFEVRACIETCIAVGLNVGYTDHRENTWSINIDDIVEWPSHLSPTPKEYGTYVEAADILLKELKNQGWRNNR